MTVPFFTNCPELQLYPLRCPQSTLMPPPDKLNEEMLKTDPRLMLSAAQNPALLLRDKGLSVRELLRQAVPVIEKLNGLLGLSSTKEVTCSVKD